MSLGLNSFSDSSVEIEKCVNILSGFSPGKPLVNYISYARFPNFKNIERGAEISFDFPFTAIVGANGSGKSSILYALYGMPDGYSTSRFWFSTELDPIVAVKDPPRSICGHWHSQYKNIVETRKARVYRKNRNYEYWEPTKATKGDGMPDIPKENYLRKDADRWNPVEREVVYLNMRKLIGSFDRNFSFGFDSLSITERHNLMKAGAKKIKSVLDRDVNTWRLGGGRERVFENRVLTDEELCWVSYILGRAYRKANYIVHNLYSIESAPDVSVVFDWGIQYSEAFAGSGEISVVHLVIKIIAAKKYSLVLIDEPETSLHPGAQRKVLEFMLKKIKEKHLQVVVSTHSQSFLDGLPDTAIKVVEHNSQGHSRILNKCSPHIALHRLGVESFNKKIIYVEDALAKLLVEQALKSMDEAEKRVFEVRVAPGGAQDMKVRQIPAHIVSDHDCYFIFDGDQKKVEKFSDPRKLPEQSVESLDGLLIKELGEVPKFFLSGGNDVEGTKSEKIKCQQEYLQWASERVKYLNYLCPEAFLLKFLGDSEEEIVSSKIAKKIFKEKYSYGMTSEQESGVVLMMLRNVPIDNSEMLFIRGLVKSWL
ncbi:ATP-dependent nuclease [Vreelandella alkaliphila]|uniref:ATP-binding protein n=1 Tax=Vreelandella alkaliphila TaxID=272774 RepID=A0AAJ2RZZ9_9GAMM|nr:ATP-binding protein [Halomonas alkaliphila]MDX5976865.1 ATP-binding protein [Halomonas alkaliphila]